MNVRRLQGRLFVSVVPCPTQAGWVTERGKDISITIAISSVFYDSSEARTESSTERERERERECLQIRMTTILDYTTVKYSIVSYNII